jgi:hypothetical protein
MSISTFIAKKDEEEAAKKAAAEKAEKERIKRNMISGYTGIKVVLTDENLWDDANKAVGSISLRLTDDGIQCFMKSMDLLGKSIFRIGNAELYKSTCGAHTIHVVADGITKDPDTVFAKIVEELNERLADLDSKIS